MFVIITPDEVYDTYVEVEKNVLFDKLIVYNIFIFFC